MCSPYKNRWSRTISIMSNCFIIRRKCSHYHDIQCGPLLWEENLAFIMRCKNFFLSHCGSPACVCIQFWLNGSTVFTSPLSSLHLSSSHPCMPSSCFSKTSLTPPSLLPADLYLSLLCFAFLSHPHNLFLCTVKLFFSSLCLCSLPPSLFCLSLIHIYVL